MANEDHELLSIYLRDHLALATGGTALAERILENNRDNAFGEALAPIVDDINEDEQTLKQVLEILGVRHSPTKEAIAWLGEKLGRLKLNGKIVSYSPLSRLVSLEALSVGVHGKRALWRSLLQAAERFPEMAESVDLEALERRATDQLDKLQKLQERAAEVAFTSDTSVDTFQDPDEMKRERPSRG